MTSLTVPLPDPMKRFVEDEAAAAGFANPVDFVHDLICRAQRDKARKDLEAKLLEAVDALDRRSDPDEGRGLGAVAV